MKSVIIDGSNFFIRYYCADKSLDQFGVPCGGLTGVLKGLKNIIKDHRPDEIIWVFDGKNNNKRKRSLDDSYKKDRTFSSIKLTVQDNEYLFEKQLSKLLNILNYLPFKVFSIDNIEGDDTIGYINYLYNNWFPGMEKIIISRDNDFLQLINENTTVIDPTKNTVHTVETFKEDKGFHPANYHLYKMLTGDRGDNVKRLLKTAKVKDIYNDILQKDYVVDIEEFIQYNKDNNITIVEETVARTNYDLVSLHSPNISMESKTQINTKLRDFTNTVYGLTNLKVQINVFGIQSHVYQDFFTFMNWYKMRNNVFNREMLKMMEME